MAPIALFAFRYRDIRTGKWVRARYRATREEIAARYSQWEVTGDPELRADDPVQMFSPGLATLVHGIRPDVPPDMRPAIDAVECFLARLFLRRYVTWCARSRHHDRIDGAALLYRKLAVRS